MNNNIRTNNTKRKPVKKPALVKKSITLAVPNNPNCDLDSLVDVLSTVTFNLININLTTKKDIVDLQGAGFATIGYVSGFGCDEEYGEYYFNVLVFDKYAEALDRYNALAIVPRVFTNAEGIVTKIIGLDIVPAPEADEEVDE